MRRTRVNEESSSQREITSLAVCDALVKKVAAHQRWLRPVRRTNSALASVALARGTCALSTTLAASATHASQRGKPFTTRNNFISGVRRTRGAPETMTYGAMGVAVRHENPTSFVSDLRKPRVKASGQPLALRTLCYIPLTCTVYMLDCLQNLSIMRHVF